MVSFIRNVSFDCSDPYALAQFWSAVVGQPVDPDFVPGDTEVDRLLVLGAKMSDDHRTSDGDGWVVLLDPAGNEFCMTRSAAERQS